MANSANLLTPEDLKHVTNLNVLARQVMEGFCSGQHRSPHKGFSVEFREHRQYVPGDEIRHLDWKVFGKTDRMYIREFEEETNLRAHILLDASGSMSYGEPGGSKFEYARRLAACLSYLLLRQQDAVGLVTFDTRARQVIPPRSRPGHLRVITEALEAGSPGGETELGTVVQALAPKIHRRSMVIFISDCFGEVSALLNALAQLRYALHDIIIFQLWHEDELDFSFKGWTRFDSLEVGDEKVLVNPAHLRSAYLDNLEAYRRELKDGCSRHRVSLVPMTLNQPYAVALANFLALRRRSQ